MTEPEAMGILRDRRDGGRPVPGVSDPQTGETDRRARQEDQTGSTVVRRHALVGSEQPLAIPVGDQTGPVDSAARLASGGRSRLADRIFFCLTAGSGGFVVVLIALVAVFLVSKAASAAASAEPRECRLAVR